jgi:hypothetical protein
MGHPCSWGNIHYLKKACENNELVFPGKTGSLGTASGFKALVNSFYACDWVVDIKDPIEKPEFVLEYLARYTTGLPFPTIASCHLKTEK